MKTRLKNINLPPIGLRIIKSAVAVFLCYLVDYLRDGSGIVFYSQLSALWCMQDYSQDTKSNAKQRTIGTFVGAFYGLIVLVLFQRAQQTQVSVVLLHAFTVSLFIIFIIYTTVVINKKNASYFSCVVFLSIVVNHINDINPFIFVFNRVLDTMIGIVIGVGVNCFSIHGRKNKDTLFLSGLDDTLLNENNNMTGFSRVELNRMLDEGLKFTISTVRTPASLLESVSDIRLRLPVIVMDGAALYNIKEKKFEKVYVISKEVSRMVSMFFEKLEVPYFSNIVIDDTVLIYYQETNNEAYNDIVKSLRKSPYRNYIMRPVPEDESVVYFMAIEKDERIREIYDRLVIFDFAKQLRITIKESTEYKGYTYIKIYNHNASKENMTHYLCGQTKTNKVVTFGTIPDKYTHIIEPGDSNRVVKMVKKEFEKF